MHVNTIIFGFTHRSVFDQRIEHNNISFPVDVFVKRASIIKSLRRKLKIIYRRYFLKNNDEDIVIIRRTNEMHNIGCIAINARLETTKTTPTPPLQYSL